MSISSFRKVLAAFALVSAGAMAAPPVDNGQLVYLGCWPHHILVFDAAKEKIVDNIELKADVPRSLVLSPDKTKIHVATINDNAIVTIDLATRKAVQSFSINTGNKNIRLGGAAADPGGRYLYAIATPIVKQIDRYEVEPIKFAVIDLQDQKITRMVDFPKDENPNVGYRSALKVSPDGKYLYLFRDSILVFDTATFKLVKKVELAKPPVPGMENLSFNMVEDPNDAPGVMTSVFNSSDPYVHRQVFGIAQVDLANLTFDFTPIGPATTSMLPLLVTPDRKTGYTVAINGTHGNRRCEFWAFDMKNRKLIRKQEFDGRTRFFFGMSPDGTKLFIYGAGYQIGVYDAKTFQLRNEVEVPGDITTNMVVLPLGQKLAASIR